MKKRHLFGLFAMAAFAFVGCSQDEVVSQSPDVNKAIEFGTYVGRDASSRGSVQNMTSLTGANAPGFGVFAYYTKTTDGYTSTSTPNFMYNQQVTGTATTVDDNTTYAWTYSPLRYWPTGANDKLTFFAYAPYDESASLTANTVAGNPKLTFTVDETVTNQIDLLYAGNFNDLKNKTKTDDAVNFQFKHALSRIGFKVKASDDRVGGIVDNSTSITVQEVQISFGDTYLASGTLDLGAGTWGHAGVTAANKTYTLNTTSGNLETATASSTAELLNKEHSYIMIIPQNITAQNIEVKVTYTITTADENVAGDATVMENNILTSNKFAFNFKQGEAYNFILDLGLKAIKLTAEVGSWDTQEGKDQTDVSFGS